MSNTVISVDLDDERSYPIYIGENILAEHTIRQHIVGKQVCIVSNETIAPLYLDTLLESLGAGYQIDTVILPDGEAYKTIDTLGLIFDQLLEKKHNRTTTLIALGGGVVGDITGFAAASYQRGVNLIQIPTTLLSQVDSSVGGKTAVNHPLGKNMIGAFYQPQAVIIDTQVLHTLPPREVSAGLAEIIKYGLIIDDEFYRWLEANMASLYALESNAINHAIARSCNSKAYVVGQDEKEQGLRAILNLGHTFGHAIESHQGYGKWLHGEAVATGMVIAAALSVRLNTIASAELDRLRTILQSAHLPITIPTDMSVDDFFEKMAVDKKVSDGKLRFVLLESIGKANIVESPDVDQVKAAILDCA